MEAQAYLESPRVSASNKAIMRTSVLRKELVERWNTSEEVIKANAVLQLPSIPLEALNDARKVWRALK